MIPFKAEIFGFRRFEEASVILDKKLIAFVGPNEAGKTSFFNALLSIENSNAYRDEELTKNFEREDEQVIRIDYLLNKEEKKLLDKFNGKGQINFYRNIKSLDGSLSHSVIGEIYRNKKHRIEFKNLLTKLSERKRIIGKSEDFNDNAKTIFEIIQDILSENWENEELSDNFYEYSNSLFDFFQEYIDEFSSTDQQFIERFFTILEKVQILENKDHPKDLILNELDRLRPKFVEFTNQERLLKGNYPLNELKQKPVALVNILNLAEVRIEEIINAIEKGHDTKRIEIIEKANKKLKSRFSSWSQSEVFPKIFIEINALKVVIDSSIGINHLRDRSDGLRQYISMKAFLEKRNDDIRPILIIDEAEQHLHYSAQANLVNDFEKQELANSIYYSTHSAGCLPSDLGTGIKVLEPIYENDKDTGRSKIRNSIWKNDSGFSPILFAMGANILAFTPARKAVFSEGPSDAILIPRIFREAMGLDFLEFQVAPGIATIKKEFVKELELEAAKEVFLVDGDKGGNENKQKLITGKINKEKIFQLPKNHTIEDFLEPNLLAEIIQNAFQTNGLSKPSFNLNKIPSKGRIAWFEKNCSDLGHGFPEKVMIADTLVSNTPSDKTIIDFSKVDKIKNLYSEISKALNLKL